MNGYRRVGVRYIVRSFIHVSKRKKCLSNLPIYLSNIPLDNTLEVMGASVDVIPVSYLLDTPLTSSIDLSGSDVVLVYSFLEAEGKQLAI
jgi:hypothetical protein